jgi:DNA-binding NarL/FixJ family response regulator
MAEVDAARKPHPRGAMVGAEAGAVSAGGLLAGNERPQIGLLATDPLRILGLRGILGDGESCDIVAISAASVADRDPLVLAILDSPAAANLLELVGALRRQRPQLNLIVLGAETDPEHIETVIGAGAKGYLSHSASEKELKMAIEVVRDGSVWAPRKVLARLLENAFQDAAPGGVSAVDFTPREQQVLRLLVLGHPNRQIAEALQVDEGTVKAHMGRLMRKAGVANRTALTMRAIERQWASVG